MSAWAVVGNKYVAYLQGTWQKYALPTRCILGMTRQRVNRILFSEVNLRNQLLFSWLAPVLIANLRNAALQR
jgi:hypothetical protein